MLYSILIWYKVIDRTRPVFLLDEKAVVVEIAIAFEKIVVYWARETMWELDADQNSHLMGSHAGQRTFAEGDCASCRNSNKVSCNRKRKLGACLRLKREILSKLACVFEKDMGKHSSDQKEKGN